MSQTIELTMLQRLNLEGIFNSQRGDVESGIAFLNKDIRDKVRVKDRDTYARVLPDGRVLLSMDAIKSAEPQTVEFDRSEISHLLRVLKSWQLSPQDLDDWAEDLLHKIERR